MRDRKDAQAHVEEGKNFNKPPVITHSCADVFGGRGARNNAPGGVGQVTKA